MYLGRHVKKNNPLRQYIMELPRNAIRKSECDDRWERIRTGRNGTMFDALMFDEYSKWTMRQYIVLGAHIMNDPNFGKITVDAQPSFVVQPLLEVVTCVDINHSKKLLISYNHN